MNDQRIHDVDAVRGFALLGIFIVNITFMASGYPGHLVTDPAFDAPLDTAVRTVSSLLVDMKFYLLFSFLFGYSFTLQMRSAARAGTAFEPRMLRRIAGLFAIGAAHTVFLYGGDVLTTYAVAGLILFRLRGIRDRTAVRTAIGLYAAAVALLLAASTVADKSSFTGPVEQARAEAAHQTRQLLEGWGGVISQHLAELPLMVVQALTLQGPTALAMFLLGMVAGRRELLARVRGDEPVLRRMQRIGFPLGLAGAAVYAFGGGNGNPLGVAVSVATAPALSAAYVATLLRIMHSPRTAWVRGVLAPGGRIALTNYLGQSVAGLLLFSGIGWGLAGSVSPAGLMALAFAVFGGQLALSACWLRLHRYGPAEWLLRWVTVGRPPTSRRRLTL